MKSQITEGENPSSLKKRRLFSLNKWTLLGRRLDLWGAETRWRAKKPNFCLQVGCGRESYLFQPLDKLETGKLN